MTYLQDMFGTVVNQPDMKENNWTAAVFYQLVCVNALNIKRTKQTEDVITMGVENCHPLANKNKNPVWCL